MPMHFKQYCISHELISLFQTPRTKIPRTFSNQFELDRAYLSLFKSNSLTNVGDCLVYGQTMDYLQLTKTETVLNNDGSTFRRVNERVHRIAAMAKLAIFRIPEHYEASHLCGRKNCINTSHLTLEPRKDNADRIACHKEGVRLGKAFCYADHGSDAPLCKKPCHREYVELQSGKQD